MEKRNLTPTHAWYKTGNAEARCARFYRASEEGSLQPKTLSRLNRWVTFLKQVGLHPYSATIILLLPMDSKSITSGSMLLM